MSSLIEVKDVSVEFPVYSQSGRSLKKHLVRATTGGRLSGESGRVVVKALQDLSFRFEHGDRVALLGHNGAGKTTLLRVLAGVYEPTDGRVRVEGRVTPLFDVGLGIDSEATGYENILLRGTLLGLSRKQIESAVENIALFTELGEYLRLPLRMYSTGMTLRLAFAISTSVHPDVLLMDEFIAVGDATFMAKARKRLDELVERAGIFVLASHSPNLVRRLCNKAIVLEAGRMVASGPVDEILEAHAA